MWTTAKLLPDYLHIPHRTKGVVCKSTSAVVTVADRYSTLLVPHHQVAGSRSQLRGAVRALRLGMVEQRLDPLVVDMGAVVVEADKE